MSNKLVKEMWEQIGHKSPVVANSNISIIEAAMMQDALDVGALIIMDGNTLIGILSERDIVRKVDANALDRSTTKVCDIMTGEILSVTPMTTHEECNRLMSENRGVRHLPVVDNGVVVGMVSMFDLIKSDEYDARISREHLEGYLTG